MEVSFVNHIPWLDKKIIKELDSIITNGPRPFDIFEWGAGGSTIWFGEKKVGRVVSTEHDREWYEKVKSEVSNLDVQILLRPPTPEEGLKHSIRMPNYDFWKYVNALSDTNEDYDLIFIDGRARVLCFLRAVYCVRNNGWIVLHDFERQDYKECREIAKLHGFSTKVIWEERATLVCQQLK